MRDPVLGAKIERAWPTATPTLLLLFAGCAAIVVAAPAIPEPGAIAFVVGGALLIVLGVRRALGGFVLHELGVRVPRLRGDRIIPASTVATLEIDVVRRYLRRKHDYTTYVVSGKDESGQRFAGVLRTRTNKHITDALVRLAQGLATRLEAVLDQGGSVPLGPIARLVASGLEHKWSPAVLKMETTLLPFEHIGEARAVTGALMGSGRISDHAERTGHASRYVQIVARDASGTTHHVRVNAAAPDAHAAYILLARKSGAALPPHMLDA